MLTPWKKSYNQLRKLKSKDITLPTKVRLVKAMVFPVVMYGCESWTIKKTEHWRIDAFELWCWRRLLRVPWTARRSNRSILEEISPGCSLEGLMLKLKPWPIPWPSDAKNWLIGKDPDDGKDWRWEEKGMTEGEMIGRHYWLDGHEFEQALGVGDRQGSLVCCSLWDGKESDMTECLNWTEHNSACMLSQVQLFNPMGHSLPGSSVHWISQARIMEWVAISFSRGFSQPRDETHVSCIAGGFFTNCAIWEEVIRLKWDL